MSTADSPQTVADHKVVTFTYSILDTEGQVLEQSDLPMSYIHGVDGKMYPKVEAALTGCTQGDEVDVTLEPRDGFGDANPDLMYRDSVDNVPPEYRRIGAEAMFQNEAGETITMKVIRIEDDEITLDANHPFAGKTVVFHIKVVDVRDATQQEIGTGEVVDFNGPLTMQ